MMTKREQVRTVRPYRTKDKMFEWEPFTRLTRKSCRDKYGALVTDEQDDPYRDVGKYFETSYEWTVENCKLKIKEILLKTE